MVTTVLPATELRSVWQARCAAPLTWTVQAPQSPAPQPYLVPVNPTWSRIAHSSGVLGSASTETCRLFKVNETMLPPPGLAFLHAHRRLAAADRDVRTARLMVQRELGLLVSLEQISVSCDHSLRTRRPQPLPACGERSPRSCAAGEGDTALARCVGWGALATCSGPELSAALSCSAC